MTSTTSPRWASFFSSWTWSTVWRFTYLLYLACFERYSKVTLRVLVTLSEVTTPMRRVRSGRFLDCTAVVISFCLLGQPYLVFFFADAARRVMMRAMSFLIFLNCETSLTFSVAER